jgi:hypothetical protein
MLPFLIQATLRRVQEPQPQRSEGVAVAFSEQSATVHLQLSPLYEL